MDKGRGVVREEAFAPMLEEIAAVISQEADSLVDEVERKLGKSLPTYAGLPPESRKEIRGLLFQLVHRALEVMDGTGPKRDDLYAFARLVGRNRLVQNLPLGDLVRAVFLVEVIVWHRVAPRMLGMDIAPSQWMRLLELQSDLNAHLVSALSASYLETRDKDISRQIAELQGLLEVGRTIVSTVELDRVLLQILEVATEIMQAPMGGVYLLEKEELRLVSMVGLGDPWKTGRRVELSRSLLSRAMEEKRPVTGVDDVLRGLDLPPPLQGGRVRSVLSCPILKDDTPLGGLELYDVQPRTYNQLDMALLSAFAPQAGVAIENARLFERERRLRRQTTMMKEMAEEAASAVKLNHALGIVLRKMAEVAGVGKGLLLLYDPQRERLTFRWGHGVGVAVTRRLRERGLAVETGKKPSLLEIMRRKDVVVLGEVEVRSRDQAEETKPLRLLSAVAVPLWTRQGPLGMLLLGDTKRRRSFDEQELDMIRAVGDQAALSIEQARVRHRIAEKERRLQELEASERVFRERERSEAIVGANPDAILLVDRDRTVSLFNPAAAELFGWREDEALGRHVHEILYGEEAESGACAREDCPVDAAFRGELRQLEMEYRRRDGSKVWISGTFSVIRNRKRQIENVICVFRDVSEQKRLQHLALVDKEIDIASRIQASLLPQGYLEDGKVRVVAHQEQARIVGGDWYDYWVEDGRLVLVIGDAAGSGIPAALLATLAMSIIRAEAKDESGPLEVIRKANRAIVPHRMEDRFITVFYGELDLETLSFRYVNAGHNDPFLIRGGSTIKTLGARKRIVLGAFEEPELSEEEIRLQPGDRLFLYTDGVVDCKDSGRRVFGENRLRRYLRASGSRRAEAFVSGLVAALHKFSGGEIEDDFTLLLCDVKLVD
jgi:PAS domain S-box-containing protein